MSNTALIHGPLPETNYLYKNVVVKGNFPLASLLIHPDTKYTIKHNFDLEGQTIELPPNCILAIDGGMIYNGTLVGNDSILIDINRLGNVLDNVIQTGTWKKQDVLNSLSIGTVISGDEPQVTITAEDGDAILNFVLPKGDKGDLGDIGDPFTYEDFTPEQLAALKGSPGDLGIRGETGNGILNTILNSNGTLTITFTDGSSYTTPSIQGPQGDSIILNNGDSYTLYNVTGENTDGAMTQKAVTDALIASSINYNNFTTGLVSENVQEAIDELTNDFQANICLFEKSSICKRATRDVNDTSWQYKDVAVIAGDTVKILVEGNISKHPTLSDARQYFEIQQLNSSSEVSSTLYSVFTTVPDNNQTARIIDSNTATLTSKTILYKVPINGYLRFRNRMSMSSGYAVNVVVLNSVIDNSNYKELSISGLTWKNMTYRSQGDFHAATSRLSCAIDTTNVKSIKIIPKGYINASVNEFGEEWVKEAENFTTDVPISVDTNLYAQGLQADSIEHAMNEGSKTFVITLGKSDNSDISISDISDKLTIYVEYKEEKKHNIRVLFIGNSLLQDAVSYMPFYMKELAPDVEFSFYLWYNSGYRLAQHLSDFQNNVSATIFSTNYGTKWNLYANSMTMAQVLAKYDFDIVVIQEYFYYWYVNNLPYTDTDLLTFNDVVTWIENNYNKPFKVATFFHPPRMNATDVNASFTFIQKNIVKILKKTVADGLLFSGIALYRALSTDLMSLGITGYLSADNVHSQEGLPCSLCAWTSIMWLLDNIGMVSRINNVLQYVNSTNWTSLNIPGPNPTNTASNPSTYVISGTDSQKKLAQDLVCKAYKECKAFVNKNLT